MSKEGNLSNLTRVRHLKERLETLTREKEAIVNAMDEVNSHSISNEGTDSMSSAYNTFNYVANNMDNYWEVTDGYVRNSVQERLKKVGIEFSTSSTISTCVSGVIAKAEERIVEIDNEINNINAKIAALSSEIYS